MTSTEVATVETTALALSPQQTYWNQNQLAALTHIGVESASEGDLHVFHHVCQRTGLDPFARQIYMIARNVREPDENGNWVTVVKQTIQTGIDGFRLIGRRAANRSKETISVAAPEWAHEDGSWRPVWRKEWGTPVAARVVINRNGMPFTAVALFDEYAQTKRNGELTAMWQQRPAGQIAKCAEALAWRMAFPQDLSGLYTDDEMDQADGYTTVVVEPDQPKGLAAALNAQTSDTTPQPSGSEAAPDATTSVSEPPGTSAPESPLLNTRGALAKRMFGLFGKLNITDKPGRLLYVSDVVGRDVKSSTDMTDADAELVIAAIEAELAAMEADKPPVAPPTDTNDDPPLPDPTDPDDPWRTPDVTP